MKGHNYVGAMFLEIAPGDFLNLEHITLVQRFDKNLTVYTSRSIVEYRVTDPKIVELILKFIEARSLLI